MHPLSIRGPAPQRTAYVTVAVKTTRRRRWALGKAALRTPNNTIVPLSLLQAARVSACRPRGAPIASSGHVPVYGELGLLHKGTRYDTDPVFAPMLVHVTIFVRRQLYGDFGSSKSLDF